MKKWLDRCALAACALASLGGLAAAVWVLVSGRIVMEGLDALFLLLVALLFALLFGSIPAQALRGGKWKRLLGRTPREEVKSEKHANA